MHTFQTRLSRMVMLGLVAVLFGSALASQASAARWAWTESKARQMVTRKATVQVPSPLRASLVSELQAGVRLYSGLQMAAMEVGDVDALATFQHLEVSYRRALARLRNGLQIQVAACTGLGVAVRGNRFARFRCPVTSMPLEIPTVELDFRDRVLPRAVEGPPRVEGPFQALLDIRVTGKSAITYRQLGSLDETRIAARRRLLHSRRRAPSPGVSSGENRAYSLCDYTMTRRLFATAVVPVGSSRMPPKACRNGHEDAQYWRA